MKAIVFLISLLNAQKLMFSTYYLLKFVVNNSFTSKKTLNMIEKFSTD